MILSINGSVPDPATPITRGVKGTNDTKTVLFINPDEVIGITQHLGGVVQIHLRFTQCSLPCYCCPIKLKDYIESHQTKAPLR